MSAQKLLYDQSYVLEPEMHLHPHQLHIFGSDKNTSSDNSNLMKSWDYLMTLWIVTVPPLLRKGHIYHIECENDVNGITCQYQDNHICSHILKFKHYQIQSKLKRDKPILTLNIK